jgi:hypothetical protein
MKRFALHGILFSALLLMMNACASKDEVVTTKPTGTVPGEKVTSEGATPGVGPGGASANVRF